MTKPDNFVKNAWQFVLRSALWIAGPLIAYLALPIEGEFWSALMPDGNHGRAYALCFVMDVVGEVMIYFFCRIRQTEAKRTKRYRAAGGILAFSGVIVIASWGVAFQQLLVVTAMVPIVAALNALIQPAVQLGVGYTQAVLEGKFDGVPRGQVAQDSTDTALVDLEAVQVTPTEPPQLDKDVRRDRVLAAMLADEPPRQADLAERFGVARSTIGNDVAYWREAGRLDDNGNGHGEGR